MFKTQENKNKAKLKTDLKIEKSKVKALIKKIENKSPEKVKSMKNKNSKPSMPKCVKVAGIVMNKSLPNLESKPNIFQRKEMDTKASLATSQVDSVPRVDIAMATPIAIPTTNLEKKMPPAVEKQDRDLASMFKEDELKADIAIPIAIPITNLEKKIPPAVEKQDRDLVSMFEEDGLEADMVKMTIQEEENHQREKRLKRAEELKKEDDEKYIMEMMKLEQRIRKKSLADELSRQAKEKAAKGAQDWVLHAEEPRTAKMKEPQEVEEKEKEMKRKKEKEEERTLALQPSLCSAQPPNPGAKLSPGMEPWIVMEVEQESVGTNQARGIKKVQDKYNTSSTPMPDLGTIQDQRDILPTRPMPTSMVLDAKGFERKRKEQRRLSMSSSRPLEEDSQPPPHQEAPQRVKELSLMFRTSNSPIKMPTFPPSSSTRGVANATINTYSPTVKKATSRTVRDKMQ